ncbi:MAG: hypothetical protein LBK66_15290 [Spirochaetaceae bacterium]|nr:hypothetical protein [Spirochaetaceae bacterium]
MNLFIIVGCVSIGVIVFAICRELYKNTGRKDVSGSLIPVYGGSPLGISIQMMRAVRKGFFLMHTLKNKAPQFNDGAWLARYKYYIQNPSVIAYIQNITGGQEYE